LPNGDTMVSAGSPVLAWLRQQQAVADECVLFLARALAFKGFWRLHSATSVNESGPALVGAAKRSPALR